MSAFSADFDHRRALRTLLAHGVDFVVIGGIAAVAHGSPRLTNDLDVSFAADPSNLEALGQALIELNARLRGAPEDVPFVPDAATLRRIEVLTLATDAGPLDVLANPAGASYATLRKTAQLADFGDFSVRIASIPSLIAMKRAAGRPKDLADIAELEAILRLRAQVRGQSPPGVIP